MDLKHEVYFTLVDYPETRNSDKALIAQIFKNHGLHRLPFEEAILNKAAPSVETIRRHRQRITQLMPDLKGNNEVESGRFERQGDYLEIAREEI